MENAEDVKTTVELYIYDLTKGIASMMSRLVIGQHVEGIWHTAIVAYGREYFFGPSGIQTARPGGTVLGEPHKVERIGETYLPYSVFFEYINGLGVSTFAPGTYNLFKHNCNSFTNEVSNFLVGQDIPKYILDLPEEILQTPIGQQIGGLIEGLCSSASRAFIVDPTFLEPRNHREVSPEFQLLNEAIEEARLNSIALEERRNEINEKLAKKDRKKKKKKKEKKQKGSKDSGASDSNSTGPSNCTHMAESESAISLSEMQASNGESTEVLPSDRVMQMEEEEKKELEERKRHRDPPIVFKDSVDIKEEYQTLVKLMDGKLNEEERVCMDELRQYVLENEGSWALGDNFLNFVGRILYDKALTSDARVKLLNILSVAALKDDVILLLHQDRREHIIMNYAFDIDRHPAEEQLPLAQFLANMFENLSSSEWLLYISEWQHQTQNISNIRVTTKVAVHSLLSNSVDLQIRGAAIIHNLACKEVKTVVFDDVAVELTMALLQYFNGSPAEEQLYACMKSLARFTQISGQDVPQLIQMIGPEPNKFRGTSERIDEQIDQYGLYSCLMGNFVYIVLGTIKEVSIGPSSLMSLLTFEYTRNMPVDFIVLFCFLAGCVQLLMGLLRLGFLVDFISMPVTSGFTSATSIIIVVSQLQGLLGLKFKAHSIVDNLSKIFQNVQNVRIPDFLLGVCSIAFLLFFRQLKDIDCCFGNDNDRSKEKRKKTWLKKFLWFLSICRNALVILITSTIAFYFEKTGSSPFILSGKIQSGLPKLSVPPFSSHVGNETYTFLDMCSHLGSGIIVLPLVSVLANVAIAKAFASGSSVNATQEMLTLGLCNIFGSFVSSMPTAGAFTRSAVVSASGVRTPMAGIYVGMMTLLALSFLTPYFYYIPRSTLAAVLISAVIFIIDLKIIRLLWKGCKRDAVAAIVTFLVSVIFGVELGLLVGALFSLIFFLRSPARPKIEVIQCKTQLGNKYIVLKPDTGVFYPAANYFCNKVMKIIHKYDENNVPFIINCERMRSIDYTAIKGIEIISANVNAEKKRLWFMNVSLRTFNNFEAFANNKHFHFIDEEDKISSIFHDGLLINNADEVKEQLLENMIGHATFTCANDNKKGAETLPKLVTNSGDDGGEVTLMLTPSQETKQT